ncbi:DUF559 domain-containing protein [Epidermidibacterium keratini]|uniref:DUF559 domain-containing protein n=1 Tax=Epidermidibacterium keratini TaxID=1891644 RepID=A0A7M3T4Z6_9ACTN|nr:DUF559 domain-containing protein [Epidermidibacterium keratini]QHB98842.1 DUF559 domain-containing protein [Epidermidibacterium keratini]
MDVLDLLQREHHGVARAGTIIAIAGRTEMLRLVRVGRLDRVCHGWYASPGAFPPARLAVAAGGALSCVSALATEGIWVPDTREIHIRVNGHTRRNPRTSCLKECANPGRVLPTPRSVDPLGTALATAAGCVTDEELVAICDSLLYRKKCDRDDLEHWLKDCRRSVRELIDWTDGRAESGTESLARFRLARRGFKVRPQVGISGVGHVDLLIGRRLVIEVDSVSYHTDVPAYNEDRRRDLILAGLGFIVVRLTYEHVMYGWDTVLPNILAITQRRDHLRDPRGFARR